jgi:sodium-dependent phosphate cotransporter
LKLSEFILDSIDNPLIVLILAIALLFGSIKLLTNVIYKILKGSARLKFEKMVFNNPLKSFGWGVALTATIQSSSVTTSVVVPLVAIGKIKLKDVYPFIVGANIGTTITALLAALFKSPEAISIAVAHLMFNLIGGVIFLFIPIFNKLPIVLADILGELCLKYRIISVIYIIIIFFLLPFAFIYMTK